MILPHPTIWFRRKWKLPKDNVKRHKRLRIIASKFEQGVDYQEYEVHRIIKTCFIDDPHKFKEALVEHGYLQKDPYIGHYRLKLKRHYSYEKDHLRNKPKQKKYRFFPD